MSTAMPVTVLCGFWPHATAEAARRILADRPSMRVLPAEDPAAGDSLVILPETSEPDQFRTAWAARGLPASVRLGSVVTVVPADLLLDAMTDETPLRTVGRHQHPADDRGIDQLVCRQLEQADVILVVGQPESGEPWESDQLHTLLHRLAPWARHLHLDDEELPAVLRRPAERVGPLAPLTRGLRGRPVGVHEPVPDNGVTACLFRARRPLHPERLHDRLADLTDQVLRSRGYFWLAGRPDLVLSWESAAGLSIGPVSRWLDDLPAEHWPSVHAERHIAAALDWDPYYGDRHHYLAFIGFDLDPVRVHRLLSGCLLTDDELSRGADTWRRYPDPFAAGYPALTG